MKNAELLKILNDIDDRFLTEDYQPTIRKRYKASFKEKVIEMKKIKLKYVLSPICVMAIVLVSVVVLNKSSDKDSLMLAKNDNTIGEESNPKIESTTKVNDEININKFETGSIFNYDTKCVDANLTE